MRTTTLLAEFAGRWLERSGNAGIAGYRRDVVEEAHVGVRRAILEVGRDSRLVRPGFAQIDDVAAIFAGRAHEVPYDLVGCWLDPVTGAGHGGRERHRIGVARQARQHHRNLSNRLVDGLGFAAPGQGKRRQRHEPQSAAHESPPESPSERCSLPLFWGGLKTAKRLICGADYVGFAA